MKVLIINSVCGTGSTGKICQDLYWKLKTLGYDCKIAWGREKKGNVPDIDTIQIGYPIDYYLHALSSRLFDNSGFCSRKATKIFIEKIEKFNPDIIHLHNIHGYYVNIELLFEYLKKCNKKIIWTLHDCWPITGHCAHMDYVQCQKWKTKCTHCVQTREYPTCYGLDRCERNFETKKRLFTNIKKMTIVTPSEWLKSIVLDSYLSDYEVKVINNSVNKEIFKNSTSNLRDKFLLKNKKIILSVANIFNGRKGIYDVVKLAKFLPEDKFKIVVIGKVNKKIIKNNKNILFLGCIQNQYELANWYSVADVFVNLTYEDTYPTVNLEAQCCKTPVIAYNTGGCVETVPNTNIVAKGKVSLVANKIIDSKYSSCCYCKDVNFELEYIKLYEE